MAETLEIILRGITKEEYNELKNAIKEEKAEGEISLSYPIYRIEGYHANFKIIEGIDNATISFNRKDIAKVYKIFEEYIFLQKIKNGK